MTDDYEFDPRGHYVYVLWGADPARPLYIGRTSRNVCARVAMQMVGERSSLIERVSLIRCQDLTEAKANELRLIHERRPVWNVVGNPGRQRPRRFGAHP